MLGKKNIKRVLSSEQKQLSHRICIGLSNTVIANSLVTVTSSCCITVVIYCQMFLGRLNEEIAIKKEGGGIIEAGGQRTWKQTVRAEYFWLTIYPMLGNFFPVFIVVILYDPVSLVVCAA